MLDERPETHYARTPQGDSIAYQVCGQGDTDLVYIPNWASPIDLMWEAPLVAPFLRRLASFTRLILFDKRGSGSSDHVSFEGLATLEDWTDDVVTVMDAVGSERAVIAGVLVGSPIAMLFAAMHPERTAGLVLVNAAARLVADDDHPGVPADRVDETVERFRASWGTSALVDAWVPSMHGDEVFARALTRFFRVGNPPATAAAVHRAQMRSDVHASLPLIQTPTLVVQRADVRGNTSPAHARYLVDHIPGAQYVEVPGADTWPYAGETSGMLDAIEEFVTGGRPSIPIDDRVLTTVLFTDIVASTEHAAKMGDRRWAELLNEHDRIVESELARYRGRKIKPTGDGMLATFDGPARAVRCARAICAAVGALGIEVRCGLHTGEIELRGDDIGGIAVHIGQRVSAQAKPGEVLVTRTVTDLVAGSGLEFEDRGECELKGIPGSWRLLAVCT